MSKTSAARFTPFDIGQIKAHMHHGLSASDIILIVKKSDGAAPSLQGVVDVMEKLLSDKRWRGEREEGSGRPRVTSKRLDKQIVDCVFRLRGTRKVTIRYLKRRYRAARAVSDSCLQDRLHEAGLEWLRRKGKSLVPKKHRKTRMKFAARVGRMFDKTLKRWGYTDGATWFLDKTDAANESTQRAALGPMMWRRTDRRDALWEECIGPSSYAKGQGEAVRLWGILANGKLNITILPKGERMNRNVYARIIRRYFPGWLDGCDLIVQDHERCLHCDEPMEAFNDIGCELVDFPPCSQDLNAIENAWKLLRERLYDTLPIALESREDFAVRARNAVRWINENRSAELKHYCSNQKERALEVRKRKGSRTSW